MVRRAGRVSSSKAAGYRAQAEKSIARQIEKDINKKLSRGIQEFAVRTMNSLAQAGPAWTGEFSASWGFAPEGTQPETPGTTGRVYKYTKNDVPVRYVERLVASGVTRFSISNTSEHAAIAIDSEQAKFYPPEYQPYPVGDVVAYGTGRPSAEHYRWDIKNQSGEDITSQITAEKDWYINYNVGGGLQKDLMNGFSFGFDDVKL